MSKNKRKLDLASLIAKHILCVQTRGKAIGKKQKQRRKLTMDRRGKKKVLLQVDCLTKKVYDVSDYSGDGKGVEYKTDNVELLFDTVHKKDVYFKYGKLETREKDTKEYWNKRAEICTQLERLKNRERKSFSMYMSEYGNIDRKRQLLQIRQDRIKKQQLLREMEQIRDKRIKRNALRRQKRAHYRYECSICMIIKDDNEYLEEWLRWHIGQGVEHFYIYDHGSQVPVTEFMASMPKELREMVTVIPFGGKHDFAQHEAYNQCLRRYRTESRWIGFFDSDEMVRVKDGTSLPKFLKKYEQYAGVFIGWITYNANGQRRKECGKVRERFRNPSSYNDQQGVGKVFVQPNYMRQMLTHNGYPLDGYFVVDENENPITDGASWVGGLTTEKICIDHYYTKSYEEWKNKISRGSCDPYYNRKYEEFFKYNPDMESCREEVFPIQVYEVGEKIKKEERKNK